MRSCEIHGTALFGHKIGGNVMNLGLNLSAVTFWQLAKRRTCKQMGRHATDTVTLEITTFAGGGSLGRAVGRSVGRSSGRPGFLSLFSLAPTVFSLFLVFGLSSEVRTKQREHFSLESFAILRPSRAKEAQLCFRSKIYVRLGLKL